MTDTSLIQSPLAYKYQSILDVFLLQGLVNYQDYQTLKDRYKSDSELEEFLLKNKILSVDSINRAYSITLKIPFIDLKNYQIPPEVLKLVNKNFIQKYQVIPFSLEDGILSLALSRPGEFDRQYLEINNYFKDKAHDVNLFITCPSDIQSVLSQYEQNPGNNVLMTKGKYPTVFLKNQNISKELFNIVPLSFAEKYHLIIFNRKGPKSFSLATDRADDPETVRAIKALEDRNNIKFQIFSISQGEVDDLFFRNKEGSQTAKSENPVPRTEESFSGNSIFGNIKDFLTNNSEKNKVTIDHVEEHKEESAPKPLEQKQQKTGTDGENAESKEVKEQPQKVENKSEQKPAENKSNNSTIDMSGEKESDQNIGSLLDEDITTLEQLTKIKETGFVPKTVAATISYALSLRASDIHMEPGSKKLRIRYRVDGVLQDVIDFPPDVTAQLISRIKILSNLKLDETRIPQDGRFDVAFKNRQVDIRVSLLPTVWGEKVVLRLLDKSQGVLSLEDLGMVGRTFDLTLEAIKQPYGIIASTGPTGSGKSTTLYAILNRISVPGVNIVTLEDPVEYEIPGVNQCQIRPKIGFSFAEGLRSILRQDPNVIMVGEVRDVETANMATHAALTGHLVLTTLHTNDASGSLPRLANMGVEPFLITSSINLIIAQRLVRRICPKCREEIKVPETLVKQLEKEVTTIPKNNKQDQSRVPKQMKFYHGKGCNECSQGYKGRLGIFESLMVSPKIEEMVISKATANDIARQAIEEGMITMRQDGILKSLAGLTTLDEVFRVTSKF